MGPNQCSPIATREPVWFTTTRVRACALGKRLDDTGVCTLNLRCVVVWSVLSRGDEDGSVTPGRVDVHSLALAGGSLKVQSAAVELRRHDVGPFVVDDQGLGMQHDLVIAVRRAHPFESMSS